MTTTNTPRTYTPETIKKHREKWITALRSGEYKRGTNFLCKTTKKGEPRKYCCLGIVHVLAKIPIVKIDEYGNFEYSTAVFGRTDPRIDTSDGFLTREAQAWLGVTHENPQIAFPDGPRQLASLNDSGWTFKRIADALEEYGIHPADDLLSKDNQ